MPTGKNILIVLVHAVPFETLSVFAFTSGLRLVPKLRLKEDVLVYGIEQLRLTDTFFVWDSGLGLATGIAIRERVTAGFNGENGVSIGDAGVRGVSGNALEKGHDREQG